MAAPRLVDALNERCDGRRLARPRDAGQDDKPLLKVYDVLPDGVAWEPDSLDGRDFHRQHANRCCESEPVAKNVDAERKAGNGERRVDFAARVDPLLLFERQHARDEPANLVFGEAVFLALAPREHLVVDSEVGREPRFQMKVGDARDAAFKESALLELAEKVHHGQRPPDAIRARAFVDFVVNGGHAVGHFCLSEVAGAYSILAPAGRNGGRAPPLSPRTGPVPTFKYRMKKLRVEPVAAPPARLRYATRVAFSVERDYNDRPLVSKGRPLCHAITCFVSAFLLTRL